MKPKNFGQIKRCFKEEIDLNSEEEYFEEESFFNSEEEFFEEESYFNLEEEFFEKESYFNLEEECFKKENYFNLKEEIFEKENFLNSEEKTFEKEFSFELSKCFKFIIHKYLLIICIFFNKINNIIKITKKIKEYIFENIFLYFRKKYLYLTKQNEIRKHSYSAKQNEIRKHLFSRKQIRIKKYFSPTKKTKTYLKMNLSFFDGDKTEEATDRKKTKSRGEGQVAKSQEVGTAFLFIAIFSALRSNAEHIYNKSLEIFNFNFVMLGEIDDIFSEDYLMKHITYTFTQILLIVMPIFAVAIIVGLIVNFVQVGWHPTTKPLKPNFKRLNPLSGLKKLFSPKQLLELVKSIAKMALISYSLNSIIEKELSGIFKIADMELFESASYIGNIAVDMGVNVGTTFLFIAGADYAYQLFKHKKDMRMSKQEVKEEHKQSEGSPEIKAAIKQRMREASMRRMMHDVKTADVIITNPTHFAVALRYDTEKDLAPVVVGKGADHMAKRIKALAKENKIEIIENKPLARALYDTCEVGKQIPQELYQSVAEILAFVYKLKNIN